MEIITIIYIAIAAWTFFTFGAGWIVGYALAVERLTRRMRRVSLDISNLEKLT